MKINWGQAILIFFICYISLLIFTVIKSRSVDHSLVANNYYQYDIAYQKKFDAITNRKYLDTDLVIQYDDTKQQLKLLFGKEKVNVNGKVIFYRASSERDDFSNDFSLKEETQYKMKTERLKPGRWKVKVEWQDETREYFKEEDIYISNV